jgi:hypothetical protein
MCIDTIPTYFWTVPASSTGKYHPNFALGNGGLLRHTCALVRIMNHTFDVKCMNNWTSRERDCLRIAGLMHDTRKSGSQEDYEKNKYTKHEHPILAAEVVRLFKGCEIIEDDEIEIIASAIESHMGMWTESKYSDIVLPEPKTKYQKMLHWCDYLASRKDIEIKFDSVKESSEPTNARDYLITFGKHNGMTLGEIWDSDPSYIEWLRTQDTKSPLTEMLEKDLNE